ncbi:MAG: hypothetical protein PF505_10045 [Vallitaleaceae bacterium]|jgi:flagellar biosynthesis/type III secretory pathway chaperone|nr:hypothetical protein [Vallitaleaceae bacterium]
MTDIVVVLEEIDASLIEKDKLIDILYESLAKQLVLLKSEDTEVNKLESIFKEKDRLYMKLDKTDNKINQLLGSISAETQLAKRFPKISVRVEEHMLAIQEKGKVIEALETESKAYINNVLAGHKESVKNFRDTKGVLKQYNRNRGYQHKSETSYFMDKKK